jgi:hypothetical protein
MSSLIIEMKAVTAKQVTVSDKLLTVVLSDGRTISVPLAWYPRLFHGTPAERNNWRFIGDGEGIHWPDLDEDISVEGLVLGKPSGESQHSLKQWLAERESALERRRARSKHTSSRSKKN